MVSHNVNARSGLASVDRIHLINIGPLQKGHGFGNILKGWVKRSIPVIKSEAKNLGKKLAVTALDTAYEVGRDILVNKKAPKEALEDQGRKGFQTFQQNFSKSSEETRAKKAIKRKNPSTSISRIRNAKRRRPKSKNNTGFRKVTL